MGFIRRRRTDPTSDRASSVQQLLDGFVADGLIDAGWQPLGDNPHEQTSSIKARAYIAWVRQHAHLAHLSPEDLRTTFLTRHHRSEPPPGSGEAWEAPERGLTAFDLAVEARRLGDRHGLD